jgi:endonuclease/exonuclease/phosphatase family metal-dependent hydrolase
VNGGIFEPKTHFAGGHVGRWFDHILVSPEFGVDKCGIYSEWLQSGTSDHAGVWADLT